MAIITTRGEQLRVRRMAEKVGGYSELVRLDAEKKAIGDDAKLIVDNSGRLTYVSPKARTG